MGSWERLRSALALFASGAFYVALGAALLLLAAAYQWDSEYHIAVGGTPLLDSPYVFDAYPPEVSATEALPFAFRWTQQTSTVLLPGVGTAAYQLALTLSPGPKPDPVVQLNINDASLATLPLAGGQRSYQLFIPPALVSSGDLRLQIVTETFTAPGDRRELGIALGQVALRPQAVALVLPPLAQLGWLGASAALVMLLGAYCGWGPRGASLIGCLWAAGTASLITFQRLWITPLSPKLVGVLLGASLLLLLLDPLLRSVWMRLHWPVHYEHPAVLGSYGQLLALASGAFVIFLSGMLHPQIQMYDIGFHVNRVLDLWVEGNYFTKTGSAEWGGRETFYPLFAYMFLAPLRLFVSDTALMLKILVATLDVVRLLALYVLVRHATGSARAAALAAFVLALLPITIISHQWGIVSNLFGETLILLSLTILVVGYRQLRWLPVFGLLTATLALALVSHPGALVLSGVVMVVLIGLLWLQRATRPVSRIVAASFVVAVLAAFGLYHWRTVGEMLPAAQQTLLSRFGATSGGGLAVTPQPAGAVCRLDTTNAVLKVQVGGSVIDPSLGLSPRCVHSWPEVLNGGLSGLGAELVAYFRLLPVLAAPFALWWLWHGGDGACTADRDRQRLLFWCLVAWLLTAALFAVVGLTINLYVRYSLFAAPALAIALGIVLARLWRVERWGWLVVWSTLLYFGVAGLGLWYTRITYAGH